MGFEIQPIRNDNKKAFGGLQKTLDGLPKEMSNLVAGFLRVVDGNL
jgi:hypothetical protein